jgi:hypothetical protein
MSDLAREARNCFEMISFICALVFGVPLMLVAVKIANELYSGPEGPLPYGHHFVHSDAMYAAILIGLIVIPTLASYVYYRRHARD